MWQWQRIRDPLRHSPPRGGYGTTAEPAEDIGRGNSQVEEVGFVIGHGILAGTYLAEYRDSLK